MDVIVIALAIAVFAAVVAAVAYFATFPSLEDLPDQSSHPTVNPLRGIDL